MTWLIGWIQNDLSDSIEWPDFQNDLSDLYGTLSMGGGEYEGDDGNLEAFLRINSYLNNSLDLRTLTSDAPQRNSIGQYLT